MAKRTTKVKQSTKLFSGHIPRVYAYLQQGSVTPSVSERYTSDPWVWFGKRNLWPEQMIALVDNCAPLQRSVHTLAMMIAGDGDMKFYTKSGEEVTEARAAMNELLQDTTWEDFLWGLSYDIALMGSPMIVVRRAAGSGIVRLDHLDVTRMRSGFLNDNTGKPDLYYWSSNWSRVRSHQRYKPTEIPRYTPGEAKAEREGYYVKTYGPGSARDCYTLPWWIGVIPAAEVWTKVDSYNKGQIDTGFSPSVHLHTFTNIEEDKLDKYDEKVMNAYSGALGRGIFHTFGTPEEGAPQLTVLPRGNHAGELDQMRDDAERVIYNGYGMPPILMGVDTKTGMDGASSAIQQAQVQVDTMLVKPKRQILTKALVRILNDMGFGEVWSAQIESMSLVAPEQDEVVLRQAYIRTVTVNEHRERVLKMEPLATDDGEKLIIGAGGDQQGQA